ncbi:hypothetical protein K439DRAFT_141284 [Ramaria rubella]|nr:hypothetical protein K439DRAFT_141284 [Ramaria rubella]
MLGLTVRSDDRQLWSKSVYQSWKMAGEGGWWTCMYQRPTGRRGEMACAYRFFFASIEDDRRSFAVHHDWPACRSMTDRTVLIRIPIGGINVRTGRFQHPHHSIHDGLDYLCIYRICDYGVMHYHFGTTHHSQQPTNAQVTPFQV